MKKFKLIILMLIIILASGCFKRDNMENINIITTVYPLEYILTKLYSESSIINSIYPDGVNIYDYEITEKQMNDYSKKDLFVYNGTGNDKDIALTLLNKNSDIKIIDANFGMEQQYGLEELWLNPSNLLMISQNIKNSLTELINSKYLIDEINNAYDELKVELSELDADIKLLAEQSSNKTIIAGSKSLQYLTKYGIEVLLINDDVANEANISKAKSAIEKKNIKSIYILEDETETKAFKQLVKDTKVKIIKIDRIDNITDEERDNKETYITLMKKNIELLREGLDS